MTIVNKLDVVQTKVIIEESDFQQIADLYNKQKFQNGEPFDGLDK